MHILGINGTPNQVGDNLYEQDERNYHDAGAVLLHDGSIVATFEEERLNRIKHTNKWPDLAIKACLKSHNLSSDDIDFFTFNVTEDTLRDFVTWRHEETGAPLSTPYSFIQELLWRQFEKTIEKERIRFYGHHRAHAATAFYPSLFSEALVLTIDGLGESDSGSIHIGNGKELRVVRLFSAEQSLGIFYSAVTNILGFAPVFDEFKVMGLAPYGNPDTFRQLFNGFYELLPEGNYVLYNEKLSELREICPPKLQSSGFSPVQKDIAAALQEALEIIVFHIVCHYRTIGGCRKLCMAGGVALNCTLNGKLIESGLFDDVFVYPAANDSGLPVGSALLGYFENDEHAERKSMHSLYLGSLLGDAKAIETEISNWNTFITYDRVSDFPRKAAELLADDKVIGWVNGPSEFAPRALGNRSILADSRPVRNKERINAIVKKREGFRPFAPSVLTEYASEYFELPPCAADFRHMTFVLPVREKYRQLLGAVTHVDGTARIQTVSRDDNRKYWELIDCFRQITDTPVILNTSFNNNVEPIVDSVHTAIVCFLTTGLDYLFIENFMITRNDFSIDDLGKLYLSVPPFVILQKPVSGKYEIATSYNDKRWHIPEAVYNLLQKADAGKTLEELLDKEQVMNEDRSEVLEQIARLWDKRLVVLNPVNHECMANKAQVEFNNKNYGEID
jgi:carbamoyltransferase